MNEVTKVTSSKSVNFPSLDWGINAGAVRDLPKDPKAAEIILAHKYIRPANEAGADVPKSPEVGENKSDQKETTAKDTGNKKGEDGKK